MLAGGPPQTISPPQPPSAESFFLAPPLPPPKQRHRPVEGQNLGVNVVKHCTCYYVWLVFIYFFCLLFDLSFCVYRVHSSLSTLLQFLSCGLKPCPRRITNGSPQDCSELVLMGIWSSRTISSCGISLHSHPLFTTRHQHQPDFLPIPYCCGCRIGCGKSGCCARTKPVKAL